MRVVPLAVLGYPNAPMTWLSGLGMTSPRDANRALEPKSSGKTKEFLFSPSDSAGDIAHHVFENWPEDWAEEAVAKAEILRLIYQGRFLHSNVTLGALGLPFGKTTVMHLVPRENLPEPNSQGEFARYDHVISSFVKIVTKLLVCLFLHFPR
ncbi:Ubiquitin-like protein 3 [Trachymyrmex septentrionalis]|uniref:Ubiquitin-like protein 3 n=1 Tax=Trachymyrmex septentrionalis TaxID=34720 RepID=A0A195FXH9_9HYME|nr:Ubiquitin-like protein 3 [Trachymyrmex septentrionalis]